MSGWENIAGLAGILGLSARFAGGGSEVLLSFLSVVSPRPFTAGSVGNNRETVSPTGTDDPSCGVSGRCGAGETSADTDSLGKCIEGRDTRLSSCRDRKGSLSEFRGGDRGDWTVNVGGSWGGARLKFTDMGRPYRRPGDPRARICSASD